MKIKCSISNILVKLRADKGISQYVLASKIGKKRSTIEQIERGINMPSFETLILIADYFNVSIDYLVGRSKINTN